MFRKIFSIGLMMLASCASFEEVIPPTDLNVAVVMPDAETSSVKSAGDAADDPAFYFNEDSPSNSFILGTDKKAGLYLYKLDGTVHQFLSIGRLNNVDLRPVSVGNTQQQLAVATNRSTNAVSFFSVDKQGATYLGEIPTVREEPYGVCLGYIEGQHYVAVPHKTGDLDVYEIDARNLMALSGGVVQQENLGGPLEGCVFDEHNNALYVGEEEAGISRYSLNVGMSSNVIVNRNRIDGLNSDTGIVADIEGVSIYETGLKSGYLIASSQGNNTFAVYDRQTNEFLIRFSIGDNVGKNIDGAEETDGLHAVSMSLPGYPQGLLLVQDGFNMPSGSKQNFKIIDWRNIQKLIDQQN